MQHKTRRVAIALCALAAVVIPALIAIVVSRPEPESVTAKRITHDDQLHAKVWRTASIK